VAGGEGVCVFRFGDDRVDVVAMRRTRSMMSCVSVPRASFVAYRHDRGGVVDFVVTSDALDRIARVCQSPLYNDYSLTFMFECNGMTEEVLHLMLCSRTASPPPLIVRATLVPARDQSDAGAAVTLVEAAMAAVARHYQYRVRVSAASLSENAKCMIDALEPSTITVLLGPDALEMAALTRDARTQLCVSWPFESGGVEGGGKRKRGGGGVGTAQLNTLLAGTSLARFRDSQRFAASTIADALAQLDSGGSETVALYLGVDGERGEAMPLLVEAVSGRWLCRVWVAPRPAAD
jgi:hypothetical protein